jgi:hypothetical protein
VPAVDDWARKIVFHAVGLKDVEIGEVAAAFRTTGLTSGLTPRI